MVSLIRAQQSFFFCGQLFLLGLLLCTFYVNLWRESLAALPEVAHYLERKASALLGADIQLSGTQGFVLDFKPHLHLSRVDVRHPVTNTPFLQLQDVHVSFNFWQSIAKRSFIFNAAHIRKVQLYPQFRGVIQRESFMKEVDWQRWVTLLLQQQQVFIHEFELMHPAIDLRLHDVALVGQETRDRQIQTDFVLSFEGVQTGGRLLLQTRGDPFLPDGHARAFVDVNSMAGVGQNSIALEFLNRLLGQDGTVDLVTQLPLLQDVRAWVSVDAGRVQDVQVQASSRGSFNSSLQLNAELGFAEVESTEQWQMSAQITQGLTQSRFDAAFADKIAFSSLSLPVRQALGLARLVMPGFLASADVQGNLENVRLHDGVLAADFKGLSYHSTSLQVGPLNGRLMGRAGEQQRLMVIDLSPSVFNFSAPSLFRQTLQDLTTAQTSMRIQQAFKPGVSQANAPKTLTRISAKNWLLQHGQTSGELDFQLTTGAATPQLALFAHFQSDAVDGYQQYLPSSLKPHVLAWLDQVVTAGALESGQIVFHGPLRPANQSQALSVTAAQPQNQQLHETQNETQNKIKTPVPVPLEPILQIGLQCRDASVRFHQDWPLMTQVNADLFIRPDAVRIDMQSAQTLGQQINGELSVSRSKAGAALLQTNIKARGPAVGVLQYLSQTPVAKVLEPILPVLKVKQGHHTSEIDLTLPLGQVEQAQVKVQTNVSAADVRLAPLKLDIDQVHGRFTFDLEQGLAAQEMSAFVLGRAVSFAMEPIIQAQARATKLTFDGDVSMQRLADWLDWPILSQHASGQTSLHGQVTLPWSQQPIVALLSSHLQGVGITLPGILGKLPQEERDWQLALEVFDSVALDILDRDHFRLQIPTLNDLSTYHLAIGDTEYALRSTSFASFNQVQGRLLSINLNTLELQPWIELQERLQAQQPTTISANNKWERQAMLPSQFKFAVADLRYQDIAFGPLRLSSYKEPNGWRLQWDGQAIGQAFIPNQTTSAPLRVSFDRLTIPRALLRRPHADQPDIETTVLNTQAWPSIELEIERLFLDETFLGQLELVGQPELDRYAVQSVYGQLAGVHLKGAGTISKKLGSEYEFTLKGNRLDNFFEILQSIDLMQADQVQFAPKAFDGQLSVQWPLFMPNRKAMQGTGQLSFYDGMIRGVEGVSPIKWLSLLSVERLTRRFLFDFDDLSQKGLAFDRLELSWRHRGLKFENSALHLQSPSLDLKANGWIDFEKKQIFQECVAIIPVIDHLLLPAAAVGVLPAAATAFVLNKAFGKKLDALTQVKWNVSGDLASPQAKQNHQ